MSLTQLSAGIMVGVFALTTIGTELFLASDNEGQWSGAAIVKGKSRKADNVSPWEVRQMMPAGPKF